MTFAIGLIVSMGCMLGGFVAIGGHLGVIWRNRCEKASPAPPVKAAPVPVNALGRDQTQAAMR